VNLAHMTGRERGEPRSPKWGEGDVVVVLENEKGSEAKFKFDFTEHHVIVFRADAYWSHEHHMSFVIIY
jgi:hypothetical protein